VQGAPERWRLIKAHGTAVGLPTDDDMGNSEVGHNALGAGQIYAQGVTTPQLSHSALCFHWSKINFAACVTNYR
jgi:bisphosphoglycerate-independent phosphoglycerate mutase (AlkP superfamily)